MNVPVSPKDNLIVKLDKAFDDEIELEGGLKLFKYTALNPEWNTTVTGHVVSVPNTLSNKPENKGIVKEAVAGDEVIVSYQVVFDMEIRDRDTPIHHNLFSHNGNNYWKVQYCHVLGYIREGKIKPASGYVFCEAIEDGTEKVGLIWMPELKKKEKVKNRYKVVSVGVNKGGEPKLSIKEGDTIRYPERLAQRYTVKGKDYIVLHQSYITAKESDN
jgi:co-chaperonin GroES (HSP10)